MYCESFDSVKFISLRIKLWILKPCYAWRKHTASFFFNQPCTSIMTNHLCKPLFLFVCSGYWLLLFVLSAKWRWQCANRWRWNKRCTYSITCYGSNTVTDELVGSCCGILPSCNPSKHINAFFDFRKFWKFEQNDFSFIKNPFVHTQRSIKRKKIYQKVCKKLLTP